MQVAVKNSCRRALEGRQLFDHVILMAPFFLGGVLYISTTKYHRSRPGAVRSSGDRKRMDLLLSFDQSQGFIPQEQDENIEVSHPCLAK